MSQEEKKGKGKKEVTFTKGAAKLLGSGLVINVPHGLGLYFGRSYRQGRY